MATGNFNYENRCILVTNEDYEDMNIPELKYHSNVFEKSNDYDFFEIVLNYGYYSDACIDYRSNDKSLEDYIEYPDYYSSVNEFFSDIQQYFAISNYRLHKLCGNLGNSDLAEYITKSIELINDYLIDKEEIKVNRYLDKIKKEYGYKELRTQAVFSNGETMYQYV